MLVILTNIIILIWRKINADLVKRSKITQQPKTIANSDTVDTKKAIIEHPKTSHKLIRL